VTADIVRSANDQMTIEAKVAFLIRPDAYPQRVDRVDCKETHMSWVFLAEGRAYKLKKPVRFPYLDFSTIERREAACRAELRLNRRLAPDIYLDVVPLTFEGSGLAIGGQGTPVDWLIVMRRLDSERMLDRRLLKHRLERVDIDRIAEVLAHFYRHVRPVFPSRASYLIKWRRALADNRRILLDRRLGLPGGEVRRIDRAQRDFLTRYAPMLAARIRTGHIRDGHGDLRPEHIWVGETIKIIDALEFNAGLRATDPLDEIAFLSVECDVLGARWVGERIRRRLAVVLGRGAPAVLYNFYRCYRASLRARLSIAHLSEPAIRMPDKWPRLARAYLRIAARDAARLQRGIRRPGDR
jgi:aminoglycoside phosphotransferase family enzyme